MVQNGRSRSGATVALLGRLVVAVGGREQPGFDGRRVQELLTYLVVNHDRQLTREAIADRLWRDGRGERRKQLRHTVWQLQHALGAAGLERLLRVDAEWMSIVPTQGVSVDVLRIEAAAQRTHGVAGAYLKDRAACELRTAVGLYCGDLLPTCYEDWCLIERERYRAIYLAMLDKLIGYAESCGRYEDGLSFGELVLRHDRASERTHRLMMRLRCLAGDRTGALRQFDLCAQTLDEELGVHPSPSTFALADMIRRGLPLDTLNDHPKRSNPHGRSGTDARESLRALQLALNDATNLAADALVALDGEGFVKRD